MSISNPYLVMIRMIKVFTEELENMTSYFIYLFLHWCIFFYLLYSFIYLCVYLFNFFCKFIYLFVKILDKFLFFFFIFFQLIYFYLWTTSFLNILLTFYQIIILQFTIAFIHQINDLITQKVICYLICFASSSDLYIGEKCIPFIFIPTLISKIIWLLYQK